MNMKKLFYLLIISFFISGCEVKLGPSQFWSKVFRTQTDSNYYKNKSEAIVNYLTQNVEEYEINKVTVIDLVDEKKNIDVAQIRKMINYTNKSTFNNKSRFILIDNIENLNKNSVNALLKIVEEPNDNIFFILINNNEKKIYPH